MTPPECVVVILSPVLNPIHIDWGQLFIVLFLNHLKHARHLIRVENRQNGATNGSHWEANNIVDVVGMDGEGVGHSNEKCGEFGCNALMCEWD
jgi:hypothetical protein